MGAKKYFLRKRPSIICADTAKRERALLIQEEVCLCQESDFECDTNYELDRSSKQCR